MCTHAQRRRFARKPSECRALVGRLRCCAGQDTSNAPVIGSNGAQPGIVDQIDRSRMKLTKHDPDEHDWIPLGWVAAADDAVHLDRSDQHAMQAWLSARPDSMTLNPR
jgi:hypothetical protein